MAVALNSSSRVWQTIIKALRKFIVHNVTFFLNQSSNIVAID